jgi:hypothetical protein
MLSELMCCTGPLRDGDFYWDFNNASGRLKLASGRLQSRLHYLRWDLRTAGCGLWIGTMIRPSGCYLDTKRTWAVESSCGL